MKNATLICVLLALSSFASAQSWTHVQAPFNLGGADLLLTDGTVLMQEEHTGKWWLLTPKQYTLDYPGGAIVPTGSLPAGYAPEFYASAVLPDGRAIVEGGEYNNGIKDHTTKGAIYDPVAGFWSMVSPPSGWTEIGDAPSVVLPDGKFMLGTCCGKKAATLDPVTLAWTDLTDTKGGGYYGKFDSNNEEGWTLMPNNNFLTVDTYIGVNDPNGMNSEYYDTTLQQWFTAGNTPAQLWDSGVTCGGKPTHEIGPAVLMYNRKIWATGANNCGDAGHTAFYDTRSGTWSSGPDFPPVNDAADAPAAIAPDGTVLIDTNPGWGHSPSTFYSFDGTTGLFTDVTPIGFDPTANTEGARMLILPSGRILVTQGAHPDLWFYEPAGTYKPSWRPQITGCYPAIAYVNQRYRVCGIQFNGLSQGSYFGDDSQNATNYPVAVITNDATGHQFFARTDRFSTMAVATGGAMVTAYFTVLPGTEGGDSTLRLITNGIPSNTVGIIIRQP